MARHPVAIAATIQEPAGAPIFPGQKDLEPILKTEGLWKLYRAGKVEVPALRGVNFEVLPGESVAVMGPSGCGKSSLLYVIGGLGTSGLPTNVVEAYDPVSDTWAGKASIPGHPSASSIAGAINGKIYVLTGNDGNLGFATLKYP